MFNHLSGFFPNLIVHNMVDLLHQQLILLLNLAKVLALKLLLLQIHLQVQSAARLRRVQSSLGIGL